MSQFFYKDGRPIPDHLVAQAISKGEALVKEGTTRIDLMNEFGESVSLPLSGVPSALASGFSIEPEVLRQKRANEQKYGNIAGFAQAMGERALSGASLGISDYIASKASPEFAAEMAARKSTVPEGLATGAEIAGSILPGLLTGGAGLAAGAGKAAAKEVGKRTLGGTIKGLAKGAVKTAGLPSAALMRGAAAAERGVGAAAKAIGLGESAAGRAISKAAQLGTSGAIEGAGFAVGEEISRASLAQEDLVAEKLLAKAKQGATFGGLSGGILGGLGSVTASSMKGMIDKMPALGRKYRTRVALESLGANKSDISKLNGKRIGYADEVADAVINHRNAAGEAIDLSDAYNSLRSASVEVGENQKNLARAIDSGMVEKGIVPDTNELKSSIIDIVNKLRSSDAPGIRKKADKIEKEFVAILDPGRAAIQKHGKGAKPEQLLFERLIDLRKDIDNIVFPETPPGAGFQLAKSSAKDLLDANNKLREFIGDVAEKHADDIGVQEATKFAETNRHHSKLISALDIAEKAERAAQGAAPSFSDKVIGAASAMTGAAISGDVTGALIGMSTGLAAKKAVESMPKLIVKVTDAVSSVDAKMSKGAKRIVFGKAVKSVVPRTAAAISTSSENRESKQKEYNKIVAQIERAQRDPSKIVDTYSQRVSDIDEYPSLAASVASKSVAALNFLASKVPDPPQDATTRLTPHLAEQKNVVIPKSELDKFMRYVSAVKDPLSVVEKLEDGEISDEGIETLRDVYPGMYSELRDKVIEQVAMAKDPIEFKRRVLLGIVFDFVSDPSMEPSFVRDIQDMYKNGVPSLGENKPKEKINIESFAKNSKTRTQELQR